MAKLISAFMLWFIGGAMLSASLQGGGGLAVTALTGNVTAADVTLAVTATDGFLVADTLFFGNGEQVSYTGVNAGHTQFTGCTRGANGTKATTHVTGDRVYTESSNVVNQALGFNPASVATSGSSNGVVLAGKIIEIVWRFFTQTLPHLVYLNFTFLTGDLWIVGYIFWALGVGLLIAIAIAFKPAVV